MRSQSKGIGSADNSASICCNIQTIPALLHCASHRRDNVWDNPPENARRKALIHKPNLTGRFPVGFIP
jgi:hypothetical protein